MQKSIVLPSRAETELRQFILKTTAKATRKDLIQLLQAVQDRYGYLSRDSLRMISKNLGVSLSEVYGVATFYHQFRLVPPGKYVIQVCMGTGCHAKGNADNFEYLRLLLGLESGEITTKDRMFSLEAARCFGCCSLAPVIMISESTGDYSRIYGHVNQKVLKKILTEYREKAIQESELRREMIICQKK
jgi:NADH:ubiquinone oxidoreductase subunit E